MTQRLLKAPQVSEITTLSVATIYEMAKKDEFPRARKVRGDRVAWLYSDVQDWMEALPVKESRTPPSAP